MVIYFVYVVMKDSGRKLNKIFFEIIFMSLHRESPKHFGGIQACLFQLKPAFKSVLGKNRRVHDIFQ